MDSFSTFLHELGLEHYRATFADNGVDLVLAPVYNWFTEGFGTQDLKDAKAVLGASSDLGCRA